MPTGKWTTPYGVNEPYALSGLRSVTNIPNTSLNPGGGGGSGTVTSVGLSLPAQFTVTGSPVTTSGTLAGAWASQAQNLVLASPNGSSGVPTFRALAAADIPSLPYTPTTLTSAHLFVGNGSNVATDVAASGDLTLANTGAFTFNTVNSNVGTFGDSTHVGQFTVNGKGLITAASSVAIVPPLVGPGCAFITAGLSIPLSGTLVDETPIPYAGLITGWTITGDTTGSASIVVSHSTYSAYDTMTTLFTASCSSAKKAQATGLSYSFAAGDIIRFSGSGFSNFTRCNITLTVSPS